MLGLVAVYWQQYGSVSNAKESSEWALIQGLLQKIINLHERLDLPGVFGCSVEGLQIAELDRLFAPDGAIIQLNTPAPVPPLTDETDNAPPPFTTGRLELDLFCDLTQAMGGVEQATIALDRVRIDEFQLFLRRMSDIWAGPEKRAKQAAKQVYTEWLGESSFSEIFGEDEDG